MGITRHDYAEVLTLLDHPEGQDAGRERVYSEWYDDIDYPRPGSRLRTLEWAHITRTWDALHVLLTGCENVDEVDYAPPTGEPPACDVIMGGLMLSHRTSRRHLRLNNLLLLTPAEVRAVDSFLEDTDLDALVRERGHLLEELNVYSFSTDMIEEGFLAHDFGVLRAFYARAAAAGNAVIKDIS
jgi:hypothetical protein